MKKIALALAALAIAAITGCASPSDQLCVTTAECAGEEDPATFCQEAAADRSEAEQKLADACQAEGDAFATCSLENGECKDKVFGGLDLLETCKTELEALAKCTTDNA